MFLFSDIFFGLLCFWLLRVAAGGRQPGGAWWTDLGGVGAVAAGLCFGGSRPGFGLLLGGGGGGGLPEEELVEEGVDRLRTLHHDHVAAVVQHLQEGQQQDLQREREREGRGEGEGESELRCSTHMQ